MSTSSGHKSPFRSYDPFQKDHDLIYKHIGITKRITRYYQYLIIAVLSIAVIIHQLKICIHYFSSKRQHHHHQYQNLRQQGDHHSHLLSNRHLITNKLSFIQKRVRQWNSFLLSNPSNQFLYSWFGNYENLINITMFYSINAFISLYKLPLDDSFNLALRFGLVSGSNIPLLYLIPLKTGPLLYLLHQSYENVLIYHKSIGILVIVTAMIHMMAFVWCLSWDYLFTSRHGLTGWVSLFCFILISFTSTRYVKQRWYELFYYMHIFNFLMFLPVFYFHHYVCKPFIIMVSGCLIFDRVVRYIWKIWVLECQVIISDEHEETLIIEIDPYVNNISNGFSKFLSWCLFKFNNGRFKYSLLSHLFITIPRINLTQSHPFSIASLPQDNKIVLIVKIHSGFTKRLFKYSQTYRNVHLTCFIHGPYGLSDSGLPHTFIQSNSNEIFMMQDDEPDELNNVSFESTSLLQSKDICTQKTYDSLRTAEPSSNQSSFSSMTSSICQHKPKQKIILVAGGSGISLILPLLYKYEKLPQFDVSLIWIIKSDSILKLPTFDRLRHEQTISNTINIWPTSLKKRPPIQELLLNVMPKEYMSGIHIIGCGPSSLMMNVKEFAVCQMNQLRDPYTEIKLILEEFSF